MRRTAKGMIKELKKKYDLVYKRVFYLTLVLLAIFIFVSINLTKKFIEKVEHNKILVSEILLKNKKISEMQGVIKTDKRIAQFKDFKLYIYVNYNKEFDKLLEIVYERAGYYEVDPYLIMAIMKIESNYNISAKSRVAYGLMQINYEVWKDEYKIDFSRIFEPHYNINIGIQIFKYYLDEAKGDTGKALHLYNNGYLYNNTKYVPKIQKLLYKRDLRR